MFCNGMLTNIEDNVSFLKQVMFSEEATFHTIGHVNWHNLRIRGLVPSKWFVEYRCDTPKVNVSCALMHKRVIWPFTLFKIKYFFYCTILHI